MSKQANHLGVKIYNDLVDEEDIWIHLRNFDALFIGIKLYVSCILLHNLLFLSVGIL